MEINVFWIKEFDNFKANFKWITNRNIEVRNKKRIQDIYKIVPNRKIHTTKSNNCLGVKYKTELNWKME